METMDSIEARIRAREVAIRLLNDLTTWIAAGSLVAVGVFSAIAAQTIPGKSSSGQPTTGDASSQAAPAPSTALYPRDNHDSSSISSSSGPPMVATGASR